ncbi:DUF2306 domain-containing protein [Paenibacillus silvisoli]|uniref:DUF2306 domain-containing protein n=1 Tax=Paenibacillus silvisoli TaxID=3110539 RepID=UPI00280600C5|nr:DUF2306 domain-containing protein [Paenibacillus silvisoli]
MKPSKKRWLLAAISVAVMLPFMYPYLTFDPDSSRVSIASVQVQYPALVLHIIFAFIAMVAGFVQFIGRIRGHRSRIHRIVGRVYVGSIFVSGLLVFVIVPYIETFTSAVSFLLLASLWLFTTWKGFRAAMQGKAGEHRVWMIRSFGITLVAVCARVIVPALLLVYGVLHGFELPGGREGMIEDILRVNIWTALVLDVVIVEWVVLSKNRKI